ncbi:hypothetical protein QBC44DRAFT_70692 [Cladorrhinum sp. PSN332]|nr:hypothetical protein QBC44DRAFT_70692 [Cladorrhinum sp. PSN332]
MKGEMSRRNLHSKWEVGVIVFFFLFFFRVKLHVSVYERESFMLNAHRMQEAEMYFYGPCIVAAFQFEGVIRVAISFLLLTHHIWMVTTSFILAPPLFEHSPPSTRRLLRGLIVNRGLASRLGMAE